MIPWWIGLIALLIFIAYAIGKVQGEREQQKPEPKKEVPTLERRRRE